MKRMLSIGILLFSLLSACNQTSVETRHGTSLQIDASPELSAIDSLVWHQPDSALVRLLPYFDTPCRDAKFCISTATEYNRHYAHLLLAELLYKNDYEQSNRPDLWQAVTYFDSLMQVLEPAVDEHGRSVERPFNRIAFLDARAHYINGVGYYENDSVVEACKEYMKALDVMEEHFAENELVEKKAKFMALTYTHLTGLFSNCYLHEQALYFGKSSLDYYRKYEAEGWHVAWALNDIGAHYDMKEEYDSATYYYKQAACIVSDTISQLYRAIATRQAFLSYEREKRPEKSLEKLYRLANQAEDDNELMSRYLVIGDIYYYEGQYDSAWVYLKQVYDNTTNVDSKILSAERLQEMSLRNGDSLNAKEYAMTHSQLVNAKALDGKIHSILSALCQQFEQNRHEIQHRLNTQQVIKRWGIVLGISISVVVVVTFFLVVSRKHNKKLQREKDDVGKLLESERQTHKMQQAAISGRLKKSNEALRIQKKETNNLAKEMAIQQRQTEWNHLNDFMNESICNDIVTALRGKKIKREAKSGDYPELHLSDAQLHELNVAVEKHFHGFEKTLTDLYPKISRNAMNQCLLYLVNMEDVQIAALLSCDYSTVKRRSAKLKQAFGTEKELRQFIREFVL